MKQILQRVFMGFVMASVAGCSGISLPDMGGILGGGSGGAVRVAENKKTNPNAPLPKYMASIRIGRYTDARKTGSPRKIGTGAENVLGMSGKDIMLDQEVAAMVTGAITTRLDDAGFQISEMPNKNALFELSGVVKELSYDVKARDEVSVAIETTLKEMGTGKVVWSGIVVEKNDRFAGVSGNNKNDIATYLHKELDIVIEKTTEAISASLRVAHPELFNFVSGANSIPGVTVLVAPTAAGTPVPPTPVQHVASIPVAAPVQAYTPQATTTSGLLLVNTSPARAKVYLDSVYYGLSPLRLEMEPGVHAISVKMEGYKMMSEKVSVRKGDSTEMNMSLEH